jgi:hypothetical protein
LVDMPWMTIYPQYAYPPILWISVWKARERRCTLC